MVLTDKTIKQIIEIKSDYEKKDLVADINFLEEVLAVLKQENNFYWYLKYQLVKNSKNATSMQDKELHFNLEKMLEKCEYAAVNWSKEIPGSKYAAISNIYALFLIFNQCAHLWQVLGRFDDPEVKRLFKDIITEQEKLSFIRFLRYDKQITKFLLRNSSVSSFRELLKIYDGTIYQDIPGYSYIAELRYLNNGESPVDATLNSLGLPNNYDFSNLTLEEKLELGVSVERPIFEQIEDIHHGLSHDIITYPEAIRKIKELSRETS